jgi:hypothetical protein
MRVRLRRTRVKGHLFRNKSLTFVYELKDSETEMDADSAASRNKCCNNDNNNNNDDRVHEWTSWEHPGTDSAATVSQGNN